MVTIAAVGNILIEYGLLSVIITTPLALFIVLGLKKKNRWALFASGGLFFSLGSAVLGITLNGITTGSVFALSRSALMVAQAENPAFFWFSTLAFVAISFAGIF